jgi:hypothetical protein
MPAKNPAAPETRDDEGIVPYKRKAPEKVTARRAGAQQSGEAMLRPNYKQCNLRRSSALAPK